MTPLHRTHTSGVPTVDLRDGSSERLTMAEAFERAQQHERKASHLRAQGRMLIARAETHERWAQRWRDWADDDYGEVPYPLEER